MNMHVQVIHDRASFDEASALIKRFGDDAVIEAATKADAFRDSGNLSLFCRWRQIERAVQLLQLEDVIGEIH